MKRISPQHNQTLFDIALQHSGSVEAVFDIARQNNLSITDAIETNQLSIPSIYNQRVVDYFATNQIIPATEPVSHPNEPQPEGIEFMAIEQNFMVY